MSQSEPLETPDPTSGTPTGPLGRQRPREGGARGHVVRLVGGPCDGGAVIVQPCEHHGFPDVLIERRTDSDAPPEPATPAVYRYSETNRRYEVLA